MNTDKNASQLRKLFRKEWDPPRADYQRRAEYFQPHDGKSLVSPMPIRRPIKLSWAS